MRLKEETGSRVSLIGVIGTFLLVYGVSYSVFLLGGLVLGARRWLDPHSGGVGFTALLLLAIVGLTFRIVKLVVPQTERVRRGWWELVLSTGVFLMAVPATVEILRTGRP